MNYLLGAKLNYLLDTCELFAGCQAELFAGYLWIICKILVNYLLGANLNRMVSSFGELLLEANNAVSSISHGLSLLLRSKTPTLPAQPLLTCSKYFLMLAIKTQYWILVSLTIPETQYWIHFVTDNPWPHQVWWCRYSKKPTELWC